MRRGNDLATRGDQRTCKNLGILRERQDRTLGRIRLRCFWNIVVVVMTGFISAIVLIEAVGSRRFCQRKLFKYMVHPVGGGEDREKQKRGGKQKTRAASAATAPYANRSSYDPGRA